jgi:hypothetical protein
MGRKTRLSDVGDGERRFHDANGVAWHVSEREAAGLPPALYFQSEMAFRRVAHYPFNWRELPSAELEVLSRAK